VVEQVVVIGAGPAGLAAGIQLQRYGMNPLVLERGQIGGLLQNANLVENYPGFPGGIPGSELVRLIQKQANLVGLQIQPADVRQLDYDGGRFLLDLGTSILTAETIVIASGTRPRQFTDFSLPLHSQDQVRYEVRDLLSTTRQQIAIVGAGDAAFDYALNLASRDNRVSILNRGEALGCLPLLWERSQREVRIQYYHHTEIQTVSQPPGGQLMLTCSSPAGISTFQVDYLLGAIGREPQTGFIAQGLRPQIEQLEAQGRIYQVGDVKNGLFRQTSIAVGDGVRAAMQIYQRAQEKYL
jgi:thioredoxin reductase (NADPH)